MALKSFGIKITRIFFLLSVICFCSINSSAQSVDPAKRIDSLMTALSDQGQFNGSILVSVKGKVIYRNAFGEANFNTQQKFTPATVSCIASLSKPFTAMTVMMLAEQNKLKYDDLISKYIPELTQFSGGITIRHLLSHTSGIPDVGDLGIDNPRLTNDKVLQTLKQFKPALRKPGLKYQYSNTGYVLLAIIVERVSGKNFNNFISENIFVPLRMTHTFLYDGIKPKPKDVAVAYDSFGALSDYAGLTTGMGGIYSTVDDLLKWDNALYTEKLVKHLTLDSAFRPFPVKEGASTYGLGWNIISKDGDKFVWHTGNTGSFRALLARQLKEQIAVIILTNKGNSKRMEINDAIVNILHGKPYTYPRMPLAEKLYSLINNQGFDKAIAFYQTLKKANDSTYDFAESELNSLGYQLLSQKKIKEAVQVFELNTLAYPSSSNAFDSLGEAYLKDGNKELAIKTYEKAVRLDPGNLSSINALKRLK